MVQNLCIWSNIVQNGSKWSQKVQNCPKGSIMIQIYLKILFKMMAVGLTVVGVTAVRNNLKF